MGLAFAKPVTKLGASGKWRNWRKVMTAKKQYCECPTCDNASEEGCMNEATILVPQSESCGSDYWLCPNCAGSVAVVNKIETGRALSFEQLAELDKAEKA